ncbi:hypothetical protein H2198_000430 [Neophaeococcomyces mojaviensis]|uniref:Uncharacterized protein n=1 Tax=Neophaeococcomyces mojaviensis TaxID=3383035 RepID=A0ACC3AKK5_9EURO|nr:hypothetical protein H2198_000430 [Knufia sp. JES_112]
MGNICSKSANKDDNFSGPGRVLGSSSNAPARTPVPQKVAANTPGRTLGSSDGASSPNNAKSAAAKAAEERANQANRSGGKLATNLAAQKKQTQNQVLNAGSEQERQARTADANTETRNWN